MVYFVLHLSQVIPDKKKSQVIIFNLGMYVSQNLSSNLGLSKHQLHFFLNFIYCLSCSIRFHLYYILLVTFFSFYLSHAVFSNLLRRAYNCKRNHILLTNLVILLMNINHLFEAYNLGVREYNI